MLRFFYLVLLVFPTMGLQANILNDTIVREAPICYATSEVEEQGSKAIQENLKFIAVESPKAFELVNKIAAKLLELEKKLCTSKRQKISRIRDLHENLEQLKPEDAPKLKQLAMMFTQSTEDMKAYTESFTLQSRDWDVAAEQMFASSTASVGNLEPAKKAQALKELQSAQLVFSKMYKTHFEEELKNSKFIVYSLEQRIRAILAVVEGKATAEELANSNIGKPLKSDSELKADIAKKIVEEAPVPVVVEKKWWEPFVEKIEKILNIKLYARPPTNEMKMNHCGEMIKADAIDIPSAPCTKNIEK